MKKPKPYYKIKDQQDLDRLITEQEGCWLECFVALNFGLRSSKGITFTGDQDYNVFNEVDDTEEVIKHDELMDTLLGEALSKGALFVY